MVQFRIPFTVSIAWITRSMCDQTQSKHDSGEVFLENFNESVFIPVVDTSIRRRQRTSRILPDVAVILHGQREVKQ